MNPSNILKISVGMILGPLIIGGISMKLFLKWNPYEKQLENAQSSEKENLKYQVLEFRNNWTKNREKNLKEIQNKSKKCLQQLNDSAKELPEPVQKIIEIIEEKDS